MQTPNNYSQRQKPFDFDFARKYSTAKRNRSFKGSSHLQVIKALKDDVIFKKIGIDKPDLHLTASLESQFLKMKQGLPAKDVEMDGADVHSRLHTLDPDT